MSEPPAVAGGPSNLDTPNPLGTDKARPLPQAVLTNQPSAMSLPGLNILSGSSSVFTRRIREAVEPNSPHASIDCLISFDAFSMTRLPPAIFVMARMRWSELTHSPVSSFELLITRSLPSARPACHRDSDEMAGPPSFIARSKKLD